MTTEALLLQVVQELREIKEAFQTSEAVNTRQALVILGLRDPMLLTHFYNKGLLTRYGSRRSGFRYDREQLKALQRRLLAGEIELPKKSEI